MVLAKLVTTGKNKLKSVYDPTCGSGSLLLRVKREVKEVSNFYGQELNRATYNLARMNMILHGVHYRQFDIKQEDTLERPQHIDKRFEAIVANPPFSAHWSASPLFMSDDRFSQYGRLAPRSVADFAFIQHMVHHLADNGNMAVVAPHGVLFRGGAEAHIRQYLIEDRNLQVNEDDKDANGHFPENTIGEADVPPIGSHTRDKLDAAIEDYNKMFGTKYSTKDSESFYNYYKDISKRVKNKEVDILLVVNMFLTGFDSKTLNTMYADKNLKYHGLIQAYSRTNRILNEQKSQGNIVCFRNLKTATDEAITLFSNKEAVEDIIMEPYEDYVEKFNQAVKELHQIAPIVNSVDDLPSIR